MTWHGWARELLAAMGIEPTGARVTFLRAWAACEGGDAQHNPLNTTLRLPGSTSYNRAGVQNYDDRLQGMAATLLTLRLGYYANLRDALHAHDLSALEIAHRAHTSIATWGTNPSCVIQQLS